MYYDYIIFWTLLFYNFLKGKKKYFFSEIVMAKCKPLWIYQI